MDGYVLVSTEKKEAKEILKTWKSKDLDDKIRLDILNFIISKTGLKALQIEEDLDLPFHMPFPRIMNKKEDKLGLGYKKWDVNASAYINLDLYKARDLIVDCFFIFVNKRSAPAVILF